MLVEECEVSDPYALVVLLHSDLVVVDLVSPGDPCCENPVTHWMCCQSPVTSCTYLADCPAGLTPVLCSPGARGRGAGHRKLHGGAGAGHGLLIHKFSVTDHNCTITMPKWKGFYDSQRNYKCDDARGRAPVWHGRGRDVMRICGESGWSVA
ncbi:hypothetical protein O3P69_018981 [Scylla paramamosain]|uniref:Uncharacterized protein n=1 Tax=Scylla paramamosain TaxID=85552 RepID=A0AAW0S9H2_SCYPA